MSTINPLARQLSAKIVFVGPGLSGKTTSLQYIHSRLDPQTRGQLISLSTDEDRTLFFDFLPLRITRVHGLGVRLHLHTVPGQVFYAETRKLVLRGADGIVFVADAQRARREANIESLDSTRQHLAEQDIELSQIPLVFQFNKRDLEGGLTQDELRADLNSFNCPEFDTVATDGTGVLEALRASVHGVVTSLNANARVRRGVRPYVNLGDMTESQRSQPLVVFPEDDNSPTSSADSPAAAPAPPSEGQAVAAAPTEPGDTAQPLTDDEATRRLTEDEAASLRPTRFSDLSMTRRGQSSSTIAAQPATNPPKLSSDDAQAQITTERPVAGVSFCELWDASQRSPIALIESCITAQRYSEAVHHSATALALLLSRLPGQLGEGVGTRALLLGLDGQQYLRLSRLAGQPDETIDVQDALFALHMLISAQIKTLGLQRLPPRP